MAHAQGAGEAGSETETATASGATSDATATETAAPASDQSSGETSEGTAGGASPTETSAVPVTDSGDPVVTPDMLPPVEPAPPAESPPASPPVPPEVPVDEGTPPPPVVEAPPVEVVAPDPPDAVPDSPVVTREVEEPGAAPGVFDERGVADALPLSAGLDATDELLKAIAPASSVRDPGQPTPRGATRPREGEAAPHEHRGLPGGSTEDSPYAPASTGSGAPSTASAGGSSGIGVAVAALLLSTCFALGLGRLLGLTAAVWRPVAFVSPLQRPD